MWWQNNAEILSDNEVIVFRSYTTRVLLVTDTKKCSPNRGGSAGLTHVPLHVHRRSVVLL